jgi:VPDSG-CTERM motif
MRTKLALLGVLGAMLVGLAATFFAVDDADAQRHPLPAVNASANASVPDGGAAVMLMGLGLTAIGVVRRFLLI